MLINQDSRSEKQVNKWCQTRNYVIGFMALQGSGSIREEKELIFLTEQRLKTRCA